MLADAVRRRIQAPRVSIWPLGRCCCCGHAVPSSSRRPPPSTVDLFRLFVTVRLRLGRWDGVRGRHRPLPLGRRRPCILWHPRLALRCSGGLGLVDAFIHAMLIECMWPRYKSARGGALHLCAASARILAYVPPHTAVLSDVCAARAPHPVRGEVLHLRTTRRGSLPSCISICSSLWSPVLRLLFLVRSCLQGLASFHRLFLHRRPPLSSGCSRPLTSVMAIRAL
ncbi:hypothetical protein SETIT_3G105000v2 [Setaria italica]|uniref:Uncharacterized protein n=1 Tax=Setaria italica TaxID=4555 RepID=A0A368QDY1_SETIT|nr:hypothetical protein SETIT_3G105000v2 [Setaria italica]